MISIEVELELSKLLRVVQFPTYSPAELSLYYLHCTHNMSDNQRAAHVLHLAKFSEFLELNLASQTANDL